MFCPKCGEKLPDDAQFCMKCGARVHALAPEGEPETYPEPEAPPRRDIAPETGRTSPERPKKRRRGLIIGLAIVIILLAAAAVLIAIFGGGGNSNIETVKTGYLGEYTDMTVETLLDNYYGLLYGSEGVWDGGVTDDGREIVQVEYSDDTGTVTIQFTMRGEDRFKVTAFVDPLSPVEETTDLLLALNNIYATSYTLEHQLEDGQEVQTSMEDRLSQVGAASVLYGAADDYSGDRSALYTAFGDSSLDMTALELMEFYSMAEIGTQEPDDAIQDEYAQGSAGGTLNLDGLEQLRGEYIGVDAEMRLSIDPDAGEGQVYFSVYYVELYWNEDIGDYEEYPSAGYSGTLQYQGDSLTGYCSDAATMESSYTQVTWDEDYFYVQIDDGYFYTQQFVR